MSNVTANNQVNLAFNQTLAYGIGQTTNLSIPLALRSLFKAAGDGQDACDLVHSKTYTLAAGTPLVLDLKALPDPVGISFALARVRLLAIRVNSTTDGQVLLVGANGSADWVGLSSSGSTVTIYPGSANNDGFAVFQMPAATGSPVGASTHLLKLDPGANTFTVDVVVAGCAA